MTDPLMTKDAFVRVATVYEDARDRILSHFGRNGGEHSNGQYNIAFFLDLKWSFEPGDEEDDPGDGGLLTIFWDDGDKVSYGTFAINRSPGYTMFKITGHSGDSSEEDSLCVVDNAKFVKPYDIEYDGDDEG